MCGESEPEAYLNRTGREGERLAVRWLERNGLVVLARNWRRGRHEIDIVAREGATTAFVEVKTRRLGPGGLPADAVDAGKRNRLCHAAAAWIRLHPRQPGEYRFDILEIVNAPGGPPLIELRRDAFQIDGG